MLLDCTLRDGGYYTGWNFSKEFLDNYLAAVDTLKLDAIEIGYCSNFSNLGFGEFYYCSDILLNYAKKNLKNNTKIGVMLNAKEFVNNIDLSCIDNKSKSIDFIRIAADPNEAKNVSLLVNEIVLKYELPVYINYMYMHLYAEDKNKINDLIQLSSHAEGISFVDSYGCIRPHQVKKTFDISRPLWSKKLGFHGHDNLGLVAANSLQAIDSGCDIVDSTFTGMGRGAGNMRTEDMALLDKNPNALCDSVSEFVSDLSKMKIEKGWGSNFAYAAAAAKEIPQKKVMDILSLNRFSLNEVLSKVLNSEVDDDGYKDLKNHLIQSSNIPPIVIGGGKTFKTFLNWRSDETFLNRKIIFISRKSLEHFLNNYNSDLSNKTQIKFIAPSEEIDSFRNLDLANTYSNIEYLAAHKIQLNNSLNSNTGTDFLLEKLEIKDGNTAILPQSPLYTALKLIELSGLSEALMIGFDGYDGKNILEYETEYCFASSNLKLVSPYASTYSLICE
tara:strand:- start:1241 stop:2743 length:1503 start_codon:yes stop_codon:yes gene_type:complete